MPTPPEYFNGIRVIESLWMTEPKEMKVSLPCGGGWTKHVMRIVEVPRRDAIVAGGQILIHPAMLPELRAASSPSQGARTMSDKPNSLGAIPASIPSDRLTALVAQWRAAADKGWESAMISPEEIDLYRVVADQLAALLTPAAAD